MLIGVPSEIKTHEYRVGLTPASVRELCERGHEAVVEHDAGDAIGLVDALYASAGARIAANAEEVFAAAALIVKVKEPQGPERVLLRDGQVLFTYLHLAPDPEQTRGLMASGCVAIAYETVTDARGGLPLLVQAAGIVLVDSQF
ncbi:MAG: alanine dehydrogenase, partial [Geminicoccaceae bacterium]